MSLTPLRYPNLMHSRIEDSASPGSESQGQNHPGRAHGMKTSVLRKSSSWCWWREGVSEQALCSLMILLTSSFLPQMVILCCALPTAVLGQRMWQRTKQTRTAGPRGSYSLMVEIINQTNKIKIYREK